MMPWFMIDKFKTFRSAVVDFHDALKKYHTFLDMQSERTAAHHASNEPVRGLKDEWSLEILESKGMGIKVTPEYKSLYEAMDSLDIYKTISLESFEPKDKSARRKWINGLKNAFPFPCAMFCYSHGNYLGNSNFVWKVPASKDDRDSAHDLQLMTDIRKLIPIYATRTMRKDFVNTYAKCPGLKPAIMRNMFRMLGYEHNPDNQTEAQIDERVVDFLLASDDTDLIFDLRAANGKLKNPEFDQFWSELGKFLDEKTIVNERRHGETLYMPMAMSVRHLREQIIERLPPGTPAPSASWIRLNFQPLNPYTKSAVSYTGKFNVKYHVQQRILRVKHEDSSYCYNQYILLKTMAVRYQKWAHFQCLDDKAIIPVGEPCMPVSTGVRARHGCLVVGSAPAPVALDHDYHVSGIVPSVCFVVKIPADSPNDSFYNGTVHVTVKDKVLEPSSPVRHAAETVALMRQHHSTDGVVLDNPILFRYTDGGPDHRTTFVSVQAAAILEFIALDLDMMVCVRTAPCQSYHNPAERMMSLLNIALQNVAYARPPMTNILESQMKSLNTLKALRRAFVRNPVLKNQFKESMHSCVQSVKDRFAVLERNEEKVKVHDAATDDEISMMTDLIKAVDDTVDFDKLSSSKETSALRVFMRQHCRVRQYTYQIKKCTEEDCTYCTVLHPPRLPEAVFKDLHFLPDPCLDANKEYCSFDQVYGTDTTDQGRPSATSKTQASEADKSHKKLLVGGG